MTRPKRFRDMGLTEGEVEAILHSHPELWDRYDASFGEMPSRLEDIIVRAKRLLPLWRKWGLRDLMLTRDVCWHCHDILALPDSPPHCERCPAECDEPDCDAVGCYGHNGESRGAGAS